MNPKTCFLGTDLTEAKRGEPAEEKVVLFLHTGGFHRSLPSSSRTDVVSCDLRILYRRPKGAQGLRPPGVRPSTRPPPPHALKKTSQHFI